VHPFTVEVARQRQAHMLDQAASARLARVARTSRPGQALVSRFADLLVKLARRPDPSLEMLRMEAAPHLAARLQRRVDIV
jgi:hypothetical protein